MVSQYCPWQNGLREAHCSCTALPLAYCSVTDCLKTEWYWNNNDFIKLIILRVRNLGRTQQGWPIEVTLYSDQSHWLDVAQLAWLEPHGLDLHSKHQLCSSVFRHLYLLRPECPSFCWHAFPGLGWLNQVELAWYLNLSSWPHYKVILGFLTWWSRVVGLLTQWLAFPRVSIPREQSGGCKASADLVSGTTQCHFWCILLVKSASQHPPGLNGWGLTLQGC